MKTSETEAIETLLARSAVYHALSVLLRHPTTWVQPTGLLSRPFESHRTGGSGEGLPEVARPRWWDYPDAHTAKWLVAREHHRLPEVLGRLGADGSATPLPYRHGFAEPVPAKLHHESGAAKQNGRLQALAHRIIRMLDSATLPDLTRQHELTFGHAVQGAAPPYELEYGEEHSHRQPQELSDIAAFYAAFGLTIAASSHERVDHIGTECEFLYYLLYKRACALDEDADEQGRVCEEAGRRFLTDHLGRWGPAFALRLTRVADDGWLGIVGTLLLEWLSQECTRMDVPLGSCDLPLRSPKEQDEAGCAACLPAQVACGGEAGVLQSFDSATPRSPARPGGPGRAGFRPTDTRGVPPRQGALDIFDVKGPLACASARGWAGCRPARGVVFQVPRACPRGSTGTD